MKKYKKKEKHPQKGGLFLFGYFSLFAFFF